MGRKIIMSLSRLQILSMGGPQQLYNPPPAVSLLTAVRLPPGVQNLLEAPAISSVDELCGSYNCAVLVRSSGSKDILTGHKAGAKATDTVLWRSSTPELAYSVNRQSPDPRPLCGSDLCLEVTRSCSIFVSS